MISKAGLIPFYIKKDGSVLVCLMVPSDPAYGGSDWQIAKGGIDYGETARMAAEREAKEELGYNHERTYGHLYHLVDMNSIRFFACQATYMVLDQYGGETGKVCWMGIDEACSIMRDWQRPVMQILRDKIYAFISSCESELKQLTEIYDSTPDEKIVEKISLANRYEKVLSSMTEQIPGYFFIDDSKKS